MSSLVDQTRLNNIIDCFRATEHLKESACVVEVGVYKGGSIEYYAPHTRRKIYGFDTFQGLPPADDRYDTHKEGDFSDTDFLVVKESLSRFHNVDLWPGIFPHTHEDEGGDLFFPERVAVAHIDVDLYNSTIESLRALHPRLLVGGYFVIDDYAAVSCPGAALAVHEFLSEYKSQYLVRSVITSQITLEKIK